MSTARAASRSLEADPSCVFAEMDIDGQQYRVEFKSIRCEVHGVLHRIPHVEGQKVPACCPLCNGWVATWLLGHKQMETQRTQVDKATADKIDERLCRNERWVIEMRDAFGTPDSFGG